MKDLIEAALKVRENAYAPYSKFQVGAALLAKSGKIYTGCNVENAAFGAGLCAERAALACAISCGEREFTHLAIVGDSGPTPCGICRQALWEFGDLQIITSSPKGDAARYKLSSLLPNAFRLYGKDDRF